MADNWIDIDAEVMRELVRWNGTRVGWFKAAICPCTGVQNVSDESVRPEGCALGCISGFVYQLQVAPDEIADSLAVISDFNKTVYSPEFGRVPSGEAKWTSMADECELSDHDIIVHYGAPQLAKTLVKRASNGDSDELPHPCVLGVRRVTRGFASWAEGGAFEVVFDESGLFPRASLRWLNLANAPQPGEFYSVDYDHYPRLIWLNDSNRPARQNHAGVRLVQRGALSILSLSRDNR